MARNREPQIFNISFLDVICGALGAVVFLFIAVPKGGSAPSKKQQLMMSYDTIHKQVFANIHDSLRSKRPGDTLFVVLADYKELPGIEDCPVCEDCPQEGSSATHAATPSAKNSDVKIKDTLAFKSLEQPNKPDDPRRSKYQGDAPGVPCKVSFEINWTDIADNVDLFVCKDNKCVSGGAREIRDIGQWDSGKAKTKFFGSDLRTTQEAVRQFDKIIAGEYKLYARLKESTKNNSSVYVRGLVYSRNDTGQEQGETFSITLPLNAPRILIGTVDLSESGAFQFTKN
ncbi:hypothetical protein SAMN04487995_0566 [Dyadobacter koreensis]|uniref:Uncharacterized protein n=1 Tax=Dyadobacter koreensis TaxID=408657 RepID=A0A1H6QE34_9BACT|nr:hypothetical protein [Dyadobacter koreensis]SEI41961.1 hypothetical protein SAMN04487995_0566 [Dyadobacter koreensis]